MNCSLAVIYLRANIHLQMNIYHIYFSVFGLPHSSETGFWGKATSGKGVRKGWFVESTGDVGERKATAVFFFFLLKMRMGDLCGQTESKFFISNTC